MKRLYYTNKRMICIFAVLFIFGLLSSMNIYPLNLAHHDSAFSYLAMIILCAPRWVIPYGSKARRKGLRYSDSRS